MTRQLPPMRPAHRPRADAGPKEPSRIVQFRIPAAWWPAIQSDAERLGMDVSAYIRAAIAEKHGGDHTLQ